MLTSHVPYAESGELSSIELDNRLESLYRENLKLSEAVDQVIQGESPDMNILESINILAALREVSEEASRNAISLNKSRSTTLKRKAGAGEDGEESSIAPSPRPGPGSRDRLGVEKSQKRGTSVPSTREVSVKIEDGAESVTSSVDGSKREFFKLSFIFAFHDVVPTTPRFGPQILLVPSWTSIARATVSLFRATDVIVSLFLNLLITVTCTPATSLSI